MSGVVVWITGLPGSGKTSVAAALLDRLHMTGRQAVQLDGDEMRRALWPEAGYDEATRRRLAMAYARLAVQLAGQGTVVVVSVVALFDAVRTWLAAHAPGYLEVLMSCPESIRLGRIPARGSRGPEVGHDLPAELPSNPHLSLVNDGQRRSVDELAECIECLLAGHETL